MHWGTRSGSLRLAGKQKSKGEKHARPKTRRAAVGCGGRRRKKIFCFPDPTKHGCVQRGGKLCSGTTGRRKTTRRAVASRKGCRRHLPSGRRAARRENGRPCSAPRCCSKHRVKSPLSHIPGPGATPSRKRKSRLPSTPGALTRRKRNRRRCNKVCDEEKKYIQKEVLAGHPPRPAFGGKKIHVAGLESRSHGCQ